METRTYVVNPIPFFMFERTFFTKLIDPEKIYKVFTFFPKGISDYNAIYYITW